MITVKQINNGNLKTAKNYADYSQKRFTGPGF